MDRPSAAAREQLDELKDDLLAMVSHDLRTPLSAIKGYAQVLQRLLLQPAPDLEQVAQGLAVIDAQTEVMGRLLTSLLDAARIRSGGFEPRPAECDLVAILELVLAGLGAEARARLQVS